ncbi:hypothetical protein LPJ74_004670 [Coemansia sp. RSA 1843]|nr:hypothetical protein LPJ74_004670 [Coemansia sp. RSA 1843]
MHWCLAGTNGTQRNLPNMPDKTHGGGNGDSTADQNDIIQIKHRNRIIKTLCSNVEQAQAEAKKSKELLKKAEDDLVKKATELNGESEKLRVYKEKLNVQKKALDEHKLKRMRADKIVADQAQQIETQQRQIEILNAELAEQKRVVNSMGDVRTVNEQLARQLKKERSKVRTVTALNTQLASRIDGAKKASDRIYHLQMQPDGPNKPGEKSYSEDNSSRLTEGSDVRMDETLAEDVAAVQNAGIKPLSTPSTLLRNELPQHRRGFTFEVPVAEFEATNIVDLTGSEPNIFSSLPEIETSAGSSSKVNNPFAAGAVQLNNTPILAPAAFQFRSPCITPNHIRGMSGRKIKSIKRPTKPSYSFSSDGLGGSRRGGNSVQAKINWGSKKS